MVAEREMKFLAEDDVDVPDLRGIVEGVVVSAPKLAALVAVYYDTADLVLARHGVTLRSRRGETGPKWTLKLPARGSGDGLLVRDEITFEGSLKAVPGAARDAVLGLCRHSPLVAVAELRTARTVTVLTLDGDVLAEICDDIVTGTRKATAGVPEVVRFREIEVELSPAADAVNGLRKAIRSALYDAGVASDGRTMSKLARVLGDAAVVLESPPAQVGHKATLGELAHATMAASVAELVRLDAYLRVDHGTEHLHAYRVATRRLRSDLRLFRSALAPAVCSTLRAELGWLAQEVGVVRDLDVLGERLARNIDRSGAIYGSREDDAAAAERLQGMLSEERRSARQALVAAMSTERYITLLDALVDLVSPTSSAFAPTMPDVQAVTSVSAVLSGPAASVTPVESEEGDVEAGRATSDRRASRVLPDLVRSQWKQLRRSADALPKHPGDEQLHAVRILTKRTRYAADAAVGVCGKDAGRFASALKELQRVLGDHQDTVVGEAWLRKAARQDPAVGIAVGLLVSLEIDERERLRRESRRAWERASRPSLRSWLD